MDENTSKGNAALAVYTGKNAFAPPKSKGSSSTRSMPRVKSKPADLKNKSSEWGSSPYMNLGKSDDRNSSKSAVNL